MLISLRLPVSYTGLAPDKITPMPGVHKTLDRSDNKSGVRFAHQRVIITRST